MTSPFDGEGAALYGGRWNSPGTAVAYSSEHLSLAVLELLVHFRTNVRTNQFLAIPAELPDEIGREMVDSADLPAGWRGIMPVEALTAIGDAWLAQARSVALVVPSAIVPQEHNVLLNPRHADFRRLIVGEPERFSFDQRLI